MTNLYIAQEGVKGNGQTVAKDTADREQSLHDNFLGNLTEGALVDRGLLQYATDYRDWETDRKSTRLNSSHSAKSRMPSSA